VLMTILCGVQRCVFYNTVWSTVLVGLIAQMVAAVGLPDLGSIQVIVTVNCNDL
jgi:hypothetical protein